MPELRQNFFTKEWVVIATERAKRPKQMIVNRPPRKQLSFSQSCPFCPGNENQTPPEILRLPTATARGKSASFPTSSPHSRARSRPPVPSTARAGPSRASFCMM